MTEAQPLRMVRTDTLGGTDILFWLNQEGRATAAPSYRFQMTTGEINWRLFTVSPEVSQRIPDYKNQLDRLRARMLAVKNVLLLPNEPMLLPDGRQNYFTIELYTVMNPDKVTLHGVFGPDGITKTYDGTQPREMTYEFEFIVLQREPDNEEALDSLAATMAYSDLVLDGAFTAQSAAPNSTIVRSG